MNNNPFIFLIITFLGSVKLSAQDLKIFDIRHYERDSTHSFAFISLSDIYPLSENPDSLATPDLSEMEIDEAPNYTYIQLDSSYRKRFLSETKISESDKVFLYDYSNNSFQSFKVKNLKVVACLTIYGADWPYTQFDYMIGFEINNKNLNGLDKYFTNSLAYVGKEHPFIRGQVKPISWSKIDPVDFPSRELPTYDISYAGKCVTSDVYKFEMEGLQYFLQDLVRLSDNQVSAKRLIVIDLITKETVCEKYFYSGESESFAPLENQWTGRLFKNKSRVIFGFHYVSFGCPGITFLNPTERTIIINCDNRH